MYPAGKGRSQKWPREPRDRLRTPQTGLTDLGRIAAHSKCSDQLRDYITLRGDKVITFIHIAQCPSLDHCPPLNIYLKIHSGDTS